MKRRDFITTTGIAMTGSVFSTPVLASKTSKFKSKIKMEEDERIVAEIRLEGCPEGQVLQWGPPPEKLAKQYAIRDNHFHGFETPLAPENVSRVLPSGMAVVKEAGRPVLDFTIDGTRRGSNDGPRALIAGPADGRNYSIFAEVKPVCTIARPNFDRADVTEAMVGVVFRMQSLRHYYFFGIEGKRQIVLYRRWDDEWFPLAKKETAIPETFLTLNVELDSDAMRCICPELDVAFFATDTLFPEGKTGIRSLGKSQVAALRITQTGSQMGRDEVRRKNALEQERARSARVPDPKLVRTLDLKELGGTPQFADFASSGRFDMLIAGDKLRALNLQGHTLWEAPVALTGIVLSKEHGPQGRLIYGLTGSRPVYQQQDEMVVIQGNTGKIIARARIPDLENTIQRVLFTLTTGNLTGNGAFDIVLREWNYGGGSGEKLWAYDQKLNLLWHADLKKPTPKAPYGHSNAVHFHDVNGDGRDEVLAGGTLYSHDGKILWIHDMNAEMYKIYQAHHYDAVAIGNFSGDPALDPTVFLTASSAGVYVVEGRTGRTRAIHRVGHAQGHTVAKMRDDLPGMEILVGCRWHNYGITTLFSGFGDRLWSIQTNGFSGGGTPILWKGHRLILMDEMLFDGEGQRVKDLAELRKMKGNINVARGMGNDPSDFLCLNADGKLYVFAPA